MAENAIYGQFITAGTAFAMTKRMKIAFPDSFTFSELELTKFIEHFPFSKCYFREKSYLAKNSSCVSK